VEHCGEDVVYYYWMNGSSQQLKVTWRGKGWCISDGLDVESNWWMSERGWGPLELSGANQRPLTLCFDAPEAAKEWLDQYADSTNWRRDDNSGRYCSIKERAGQLMSSNHAWKSSPYSQGFVQDWLLAHPEHVEFLSDLARMVEDWSEGLKIEPSKLQFYLRDKEDRLVLFILWPHRRGLRSLQERVRGFGTGYTLGLTANL
jgi:hypothetical protein